MDCLTDRGSVVSDVLRGDGSTEFVTTIVGPLMCGEMLSDDYRAFCADAVAFGASPTV